MQKIGGGGGDKQGALWEMWEWRIAEKLMYSQLSPCGHPDNTDSR